MTEFSGRLFVSRLAFRLGVVMRDRSRKESRSEAISRTLQVENLDFGKVAVETPYYWAVYYHDGRRGIRARPGHKLVYFRNIDQDPRVRGRNYPRRYSEVRRLTKDEFYRMRRDPSSGMIVRDSVGPAPGDPFFKRAGRGMPRKASEIAQREFSGLVRSTLGDLLKASASLTVNL